MRGFQFWVPFFWKIHLQLTHNLQGSTHTKGTGHTRKIIISNWARFGSGRVSDIDNPYQVCGISRCEKYKLCATNEMPKYTMSAYVCVCVCLLMFGLAIDLVPPLRACTEGVAHLNPSRPPTNKIWRCKFCDIETKIR